MWRKPPPPAQPPACPCGDPFAPFGLGPPLVERQQWWCGTCIQRQPATQNTIAKKMREAIE